MTNQEILKDTGWIDIKVKKPELHAVVWGCNEHNEVGLYLYYSCNEYGQTEWINISHGLAHIFEKNVYLWKPLEKPEEPYTRKQMLLDEFEKANPYVGITKEDNKIIIAYTYWWANKVFSIEIEKTQRKDKYIISNIKNYSSSDYELLLNTIKLVEKLNDDLSRSN